MFTNNSIDFFKDIETLSKTTKIDLIESNGQIDWLQ